MRSLRARLTLGIALVLAAVIAGFSIALHTVSARASAAAARAHLESVADRISASVEWAGGDKEEGEKDGKKKGAGAFKVESDMLGGLLGNPGIAFRIEAPGGQVLKTWSPPGWPEDRLKDMPRAAAGGSLQSGDRHWHATVLTRAARTDEEERERPPGPVTLAVAVDVTENVRALHRLAAALWILGPLVFLLGAGGVAWRVSRGLAPLRAMGEAAVRIDERTLSERVPVPPTGDELARLGDSLNAALARLESAFGRERAFIADASHELRTPVSILLTTLEVDRARPRSPEETAETMETLLQATRRLRGIVESMLTLARADAGRLPLHREPVDLAALLRQSADLLAPLAAPRKVDLVVRAEGPIPVSGDAGLLRQLVDNLVTNAIRYNREGGRVEIACARAAGTVTLSVADTGIGIPAEHVPHVFERLHRVDKGRSREAGGAGLGLSIAKWIAETHGGTIGVDSVEGAGTTFRVSLPSGDDAPGPSGRRA